MMGTKARELDPHHQGDRGACGICNPPDPRKRVSADKVWAATLKYGGRSHR